MENKCPLRVRAFYVRLYELVDDPLTDSIISWSKSNKSFVIWDPEGISHRKFLSRFGCRNKLSEFIEELNYYGFKRIEGSEQLEFGHKKYFVRGQPELLMKLHSETCMTRMENRFREIKAKQQVENGMQHLRI